MEIGEIKRVLKTFNQEDKLPEVLYWHCQGLTDSEVGNKVGFSGNTIYIRKQIILGILKSHGIEKIDVNVRQAIEELCGSPPSFDPWPPLEPEAQMEVAPTQEYDEDSNQDEVAQPESELDPQMGQEPNMLLEPEPDTPFPQPEPSPEQEVREPFSLPFDLSLRNIGIGILVLALLFGAWRTILTIRGDNPFTNETRESDLGVESAERVDDAEPTPPPTADLTATHQAQENVVNATLTARAPTPDATLTQEGLDSQVALAVGATETALVTDTPLPTSTNTPIPSSTPTPTETATPTNTPTPTAIPLAVGGIAEDDRISMQLVEVEYNKGFAIIGVGVTAGAMLHFEFTNIDVEEFHLAFIYRDLISLTDNLGREYNHFKRGPSGTGGTQVNEYLNRAETYKFNVPFEQGNAFDNQVDYLIVTIHDFSSLGDITWRIEIEN